MPRATVIIPTHDHGPMIRYSVASVLEQTFTDLELVVICDGSPPETRAIIDELAATDSRVSYRWCEKGERLGETHRNAVLDGCSSDFVCYLSDDDLWAPGHLEAMSRALHRSDVAHTNHLFVDGEGALHLVAVDLNEVSMRTAHLAGSSFVSLSALGHTLDAVRKGLRWRVTPTGSYTDWYFLVGAMELDLTIGFTDDITMLNIAGVFRAGWSLERRLAEIAGWRDEVSERWPAVVHSTMLASARAERSRVRGHDDWSEATRNQLQEQLSNLVVEAQRANAQMTAVIEDLAAQRIAVVDLGRSIGEGHEREQALEERISTCDALVAQLTATLDGQRSAMGDLERRHEVLLATKLARLQQRLARSPAARRLIGGPR